MDSVSVTMQLDYGDTRCRTGYLNSESEFGKEVVCWSRSLMANFLVSHRYGPQNVANVRAELSEPDETYKRLEC